MRLNNIPQINKNIKRTHKAIVALGCSFTQGHGALNENIYKTYPWQFDKKNHAGIKWDLSLDQIKQLTSDYNDITLSHGDLDFYEHELNNSYVSILCKKYLNNDYAAINLGRSGNGNKATIKELYFYPDILWDEIKELIVIYCPTGLERLDLIDDQFHEVNNHGRWKTIFPAPMFNDQEIMKNFSLGYVKGFISEKFEVLQQISIIQELVTWCNYKNAKLLITPAFNKTYDKLLFSQSLATRIIRDSDRKIIHEDRNYHDINSPDILKLVNMWPWDNMFIPNGYHTFIDLCIAQEVQDWQNAPFFYNYIGTGSPDLWITPCCHPSAKGHDLFAKYLADHIKNNIL